MTAHVSRPLRAVSLFTNCGAGDLGFAAAGFSFEVMAELDSRRLNVALLNHPSAAGVPGDLRTTLPEVVEVYRARAGNEPPALIAACPPCQGLSSAQSSRGPEGDPDAGTNDPRNLLVAVVAEAARALAPRILVVENVQAFLTRKVRHPQTNVPVSGAHYLINQLTADYMVYPLLADLAHFGIPQSRKRCFLTFVRRGEEAVRILEHRNWVPYPWPSHAGVLTSPLPLRAALSSFRLPALDAQDRASASSNIAMHTVPVWQPNRYRMISSIPPNSGLSAWENDRCPECNHIANDGSRVQCPQCGAPLLRPVAPAQDGQLRLIRGFRSSYRRMNPDAPAATITTASGHVGSDRTVHPWENRVLSPLECALLQTFPRSFKWGEALELWGHTNVRAMIGEAVPPLFTKKHGRVLAQLINGIPPRLALSVRDARVSAAYRALGRAARVTAPGATRH